MASLLAKIIGDFNTQLATKLAVGGTSATLASATDDDGVALPAGRYFFTIDGDNSNKEHISCSLSSTALTSIKSVSRQGVETSGVVRVHRIGATVVITDFKHIKAINDLLDGTTDFNASVPLKYDGTATINNDNMFATKAYVDGVAVSGAPNASTTVKGIVEEATLAEVMARTATGGTAARLYVNPANLNSVLMHDYAASAAGSDTYAITLSPVPAAYVTGDIYVFKADVANTGAATLNVNALGAKTIKRLNGDALIDGDILASATVIVTYNGTDMLLLTSDAATRAGIQNSSYKYAASAAGSDTYAVTLSPAPLAYAAGQEFSFKADVGNTGAATLNVNALGAKTIKKNVTEDLATGDIIANQIVTVRYDGTNMQMLAGVSGSRFSAGEDLTGVVITSSGTDMKVGFAAEDFDNLAEYATGTFTAVATGVYMFTASLIIQAAANVNAATFQAWFKKNSTALEVLSMTEAAVTGNVTTPNFTISALLSLTAGDTIEVHATESVGGTFGTNTIFGKRFSGYRIA